VRPDPIAGARFRLARAAVGLPVVLLVGLRSLPAGTRPMLNGFLAVGGWLVLGTVLAAWSRFGGRRPRTALASLLVGDLLATAVAVRLAGDLGGPTLLLLAIPVLAAGLLLEWRVGLALGLLAAIVSRALALLPRGVGVDPLGASALYYAGAFGTVGLAAGLLGSRLAASLRDAARSRGELEVARLSTDRIVESLGCGLIAVDGAGRVRTVNREARRLLGLSGDTAAIERALQRDHPRLARWLTARAGRERARGGERVLRPPGRRPFRAWLKLAPITGAGGACHGRVLLFWDLTERKRLERAARRSQQRDAIALLSGGLAHEIRNSLRPITGCAELLQSQRLLPAAATPMVDVIMREAGSLEAFLSQFLALARDKTLKLEAIDLDELIGQEAHALALASTPADARVVVEGERELRVRGDRDWLRQVFRNLILNGLEAKPGGAVRVRLARIRRHDRAWVRVTVEDDGPGIAPEDRRRAFRAFWSGKPTGTGLGLPIALRGVREHGGCIRLDARRSVGTAVRVELPLNGPSDRATGSLAA
jgi:signal transduction histidine kinase